MVTYDVNQPDEVDFHEYYHRLLPDQYSHPKPLVYPYRDYLILHRQLHLPQLLPHSALGLPQSQKQRVFSGDFVVDHDGKYIPAAEFEPNSQRVAHFQVD